VTPKFSGSPMTSTSSQCSASHAGVLSREPLSTKIVPKATPRWAASDSRIVSRSAMPS